jgi:hypothetical protein
MDYINLAFQYECTQVRHTVISSGSRYASPNNRSCENSAKSFLLKISHLKNCRKSTNRM